MYEATDALKLLHQRAFGCGHLMHEECLSYLQKEIASIHPIANQAPYSLIGNGLCRLHLAHPQVHALPPAWIFAMMQATQAGFTPKKESFMQEVQWLQALSAEGKTPFSQEELQRFWQAYDQENCPPFRHSEAYRKANAPAYRVVSTDFAILLPLLAHLNTNSSVAVVVMDGDCGAGKTTLANRLASVLSLAHIPLDDFFLPPTLRNDERLSMPGGNVDYERFAQEVLVPLSAQQPFTYQAFSCQTHGMTPKTVATAPLYLLEGSYALHPYFDEFYDALQATKVFVEVDNSTQKQRLQLRNPALYPRFEAEWIPLEKKYQKAYDTGKKADIILHSLPWYTHSITREKVELL